MNFYRPGSSRQPIFQGVLDQIVHHKHEEVMQRQQYRSLDDLCQEVFPLETPGQLISVLKEKSPETKLILEVKPSSPSAGILDAQLDVPALIALYNHYGIGVSVLTDERYFGGSLGLLEKVIQQTDLPVLCKDFILDPYQVYEARKAGASVVLLIVKALAQSQLIELQSVICELGMTPLIEIQNFREMERALDIEPEIVLINNRDLQTLAMDLETTPRLSREIPSEVLRVSASGVSHRKEIEFLKPFCQGFLMGSALMKLSQDQREAKLQELTQS